jgi:undecaprenyl-diphosphatase
MAEVANDSTNPDIGLLRSINDLAKQAPRGVDRAVEFAGEYGLIVLTALLAGWCWWRLARRSADAPAAVAGVLWSCLAAGIALLLNFPVRALVQRPRPFVDHDGLDVLVRGHHTASFVSDHVALTAAVAVGLFMVSRKAGAVAIAVALAEGFAQVYLGAHYPTDVVGGFALGAATALLLAPPALALLTALTRAVARTRAAFLVQARPAVPGRPARTASPHRWHSAADKDLAA